MPDIDTPEIDQHVLPLLPLTTGVVLPGMVVTLTLETDEAHAAAEAAASTDDALLLLVPKVDGAYARVGTVAKIEELGQTRGGVEALVIRGISRAVVGVGVPGTGEAVWVQADPVDEPEPSARARELAREYRAVDREHRRGARRAAGGGVPARHRRPRADRRHQRLLARPELRAQGRGARDGRRRGAPRARHRVGQGHARRDRAEGQDPHRRQRGHGEAPARVPAARADERDPQGARRGRRGRRRRRATARRSPRRACPTTCWPRPRRSSAASSARASSRPSTAGSAPTSTGSSTCRGACAPTTTSRSPRRARCSTPTTRGSTT